MRILHIDSSILGNNSLSRVITAQILQKLTTEHPDASVVYHDLAVDTVPHLTGAYLAAVQGMTQDHEPELQADLAIGARVLDAFIAADIVVIGAGLYNLTVPTQLKAWIDRIIIVGQTFRYNEKGELVGLMGDKRVILGIARGGFYSPGSPGAVIEHCESLLRATLGFIGISDIDAITSDGAAVGPEHLAAAQEHIAAQLALLRV